MFCCTTTLKLSESTQNGSIFSSLFGNNDVDVPDDFPRLSTYTSSLISVRWITDKRP